uniref:DSL domain-containing protein n=1 Tax=Parascaris univalens TaxID=6257 RepID=A0A915C130_PARUN
MYITRSCIAFLLIDFASSSLLFNIGNITVGCTRSLRGANLTVTLDVYSDKTFVSRSFSFYNETVDYYYAKSMEVFSFTVSNDTSVILLKSKATLITFDGTVNVYEGSANLLTLNAYNWDGTMQESLNASFSDPIQRSHIGIQLHSGNIFKWYDSFLSTTKMEKLPPAKLNSSLI